MLHIHNHSHHIHKGEKNNLIKFASYASVLAASIIIIIKLTAWFITGSLTVLATLADSFLDIISSIVNLIAVKYAMQPPDNEHRFGHNKAEDLAVFTQSAFFGASGVFLIIIAMQRFFSPEIVEHSNIGVMIMIVSIIITSFLILFQKLVIKKTNSHIIEADYLHYSVDLFSNIAVIISLWIGSRFNIKFIDPLFALAIAIYIMYNAWHLLKRAFNNLMDREFADNQKQKIYEIAIANPRSINIHDLKTRYAGSKAFIQFHLQLASDISLMEAHDIADEIENELLKYFPGADILIHQDPEGADEKIIYPNVV